MTHSKSSDYAIQCVLLGITLLQFLSTPAGHTHEMQPINSPKALTLPRPGKVKRALFDLEIIQTTCCCNLMLVKIKL